MRRLAIALLIACGSEAPVAIPPGMVIAPPAPTPKKRALVVLPKPPDPEPKSPVNASFVSLQGKWTSSQEACDVRAVFLVRGKATLGKEGLAVGDLVVSEGKGTYDLDGDGDAVVATVRATACDAAKPFTERVVLGKSAPDLKWAKGAMRARLDVEGVPSAYFGRLEGAAPVAEHTHEASWEVLCAIEAQGTFTLAGAPQRLGPKTCVSVPPKTLHAWSPDAGSKLVAVQIYSPAGPEQRFKGLAAQEDAGAKAPKP